MTMDTRMYNPPHPGEVLYGLHMEPLGLTQVEVAQRLGVDRKTLSRLINGHTSVSVEMAMRLGQAFNTSPDLWLNIQKSYDLWHVARAHKAEIAKIRPFRKPAKRKAA